MTTPSTCLLELSQLRPRMKNLRDELKQIQTRIDFLEANLLIFAKQMKLSETNFGKTLSSNELKKIFDEKRVETKTKKKLANKKSVLK
jgi:hypothetical protein